MWVDINSCMTDFNSCIDLTLVWVQLDKFHFLFVTFSSFFGRGGGSSRIFRPHEGGGGREKINVEGSYYVLQEIPIKSHQPKFFKEFWWWWCPDNWTSKINCKLFFDILNIFKRRKLKKIILLLVTLLTSHYCCCFRAELYWRDEYSLCQQIWQNRLKLLQNSRTSDVVDFKFHFCRFTKRRSAPIDLLKP